MKNIMLSLAFLLTFFNSVQAQKFKLLGKWQQTEEQGSDGAKEFTRQIKNGEILIFEQQNVVKDSLGNVGKFKISGNKLHISLANKERFYFVFRYEKSPTKIYLSPVTSEYEIICDEGCSFTYEKIVSN